MESSKCPQPITPSQQKVEPWDQQDEYFATIFHPWGSLPAKGSSEHEFLQTLRNLDNVIVTFEDHIDHSEQGFDLWRSRHQMAMEKLEEPIPEYPALRLNYGPGPIQWDDDAWDSRYRYMIIQRRNMTEERLRDALQMSAPMVKRFFGVCFAPDRQQWFDRRRNRRLRMSSQWWEPLDELLMQVAEKWKVDGEDLKYEFWGPQNMGAHLKGEEEEEEENETKLMNNMASGSSDFHDQPVTESGVKIEQDESSGGLAFQIPLKRPKEE